uniref:Calcineurin-like phosphoesterase domain-containing protein n=1 Tax=Muribaculaceae bacterium Z82 TaxID=2304548 RepID=A0A7C9JCE9_9BACT
MFLSGEEERPVLNCVCDVGKGKDTETQTSRNLADETTLNKHGSGQGLEQRQMVHSLCLNEDDSGMQRFYYISDVHVEYQIRPEELDGEVGRAIREKVSELISSIEKPGPVLVGGDVSANYECLEKFYDSLNDAMSSSPIYSNRAYIVSVFGNHETAFMEWGDDRGQHVDPRFSKKKFDALRRAIEGHPHLVDSFLLDNELFIEYNGMSRFKRHRSVIGEDDILSMSEDDLRERLLQATTIILGGEGNVHEGFSGLRSFSDVYEKVLSVAKDDRVIVLTHHPMSSWSASEPNSNWIYVSGHTHKRSARELENGAIILSDGQIGKTPCRWFFKSFLKSGFYDPFLSWEDGVYEIDRQQYMDFNAGRGIEASRVNRKGQIVMIKRDDVYMFLLRGQSKTYILDGANIKTAEHESDYYYANLPIYVGVLRHSFARYREAIRLIAQEVKRIGGRGDIHGCIVDISFYNHIYLDPWTGEIKPYYARENGHERYYSNLFELLSCSPDRGSRRLSGCRDLLADKEVCRDLPILSRENKISITAEFAFPKSSSSRMMRKIQYALDDGVVREWNDAALEVGLADAAESSPGLSESGEVDTPLIGAGT